jgi:imidazole glycerol-phosphate synthase subunit HisF
MPLTVGGGVRSVEDARALLLAGADKVAVNSARPSPARSGGRHRRRMGSQCVVASVDARRGRAATGKSSPTAAARRPGSTRWNTPCGWQSWARASCWSPRWTATARKRLRPQAHPHHRRCRIRAGDRQRRGRHAGSPRRGRDQGHASAVLAASIFHFGTHTIAEAHAALRAAGPARATIAPPPRRMMTPPVKSGPRYNQMIVSRTRFASSTRTARISASCTPAKRSNRPPKSA